MHINKLHQLNSEIFLLYYRKIGNGHDYSFSSISIGTIVWRPVGEQLDDAMVAGIYTRYFTDHLIEAV